MATVSSQQATRIHPKAHRPVVEALGVREGALHVVDPETQQRAD